MRQHNTTQHNARQHETRQHKTTQDNEDNEDNPNVIYLVLLPSWFRSKTVRPETSSLSSMNGLVFYYKFLIGVLFLISNSSNSSFIGYFVGLVLSCLVLSCFVLSCLVLSFPVLCCAVLSCPVFSCFVLSFCFVFLFALPCLVPSRPCLVLVLLCIV
jgi:hypothetical protein